MARRKKQDAALGVLVVLAVVIGGPIWLLSKVTDSLGGIPMVLAIALLISGFVWFRKRQREQRRAYLLTKYGDPAIVEWIMRRLYWQGQTAQQLVDSIGLPIAVDNALLKTRKREVWKYHQTGVNRFQLRLTLENDIVVGWDQKA